MNTETLDAPVGAARAANGPFETFWRGRAERERQALLVGGIALLVFLVWLVLIQPAWKTLRAAPEELDRLDRQLQQIQSTAAEVKDLRAIAPVSSAQATAAIQAATERLGDKARLSLQSERAVLTLVGVDADALRGWLTEIRTAARARPVEASLSRAAQGYSGTIVLTLGGAS